MRDFLEGKLVKPDPASHMVHARPDWAIVSREDFDAAQREIAARQLRYGSGKPGAGGRHSARHALSTLLRCAHCGRAFVRRSYTYVNTRVYWVCSTNNQYTGEGCDNRVKVEENWLLLQLSAYLLDTIGGKEPFLEQALEEEARLPQRTDQSTDVEALRGHIAQCDRRIARYQEQMREVINQDLRTLIETVTVDRGGRVEVGSNPGCFPVIAA